MYFLGETVYLGAGKGNVRVMVGLWVWFQICVECSVSQIWEIILDTLAVKITGILSQRCSTQYFSPQDSLEFTVVAVITTANIIVSRLVPGTVLRLYILY